MAIMRSQLKFERGKKIAPPPEFEPRPPGTKSQCPINELHYRVFFTFSGEHYFCLLYCLSSKSRLIEKKISFQNNPGMRFRNVRTLLS